MRTSRNPSILFIVTVLFISPFFIPVRAAAEDVGLLLRLDDGVRPAPLLGTFVHVEVTGIIARATVTQSFTNPTADYVEAVYVFPLPEKAAVDALRMTIGERQIEGEIHAAAEAAEIYREASAEGRKAALLEAQRPNVFTARVTQIGPGETVEIEIGMQLEVDYDLGTFRLRFPLVVAPRYAPGDGMLQPPVAACEVNPTAFSVDVAAGFPVARVASRNHEIRVEHGAGNRFAVELADEVVAADRDFVLEWTPEPGRTPRAVTYVQEVDGERYALLMVIPPAPEALAAARLPREAVFVVDTSGSMNGRKLEQARAALLMALDQLQPGDRVNVMQFDDTTDALFPESRDVDDATLDEARRFVKDLRVRGGTEMLPAIKKALDDPYPDGGLRQVVFVTDGQVGNEDELFKSIQKRLGRSRLFTVGIGAAPNGHFMRRAAELGRGTFTFIDEADDVAAGMGSLLRKLDAPVLRDVEVDWGDPAAEASPSRVPDLYLGEPLVVAARVGDTESVRLAGWLREKRLELTLPLAETQALAKALAVPEAAAGIDKLWARRRIDAILAEPDAAPEDVQARVVEIALRHQLVTDYTSLVTVDTLPTAPAEEPESYLMAVNAAGGGGVEETITVTSESPLLDARRIATGVSVSQVELEKIPSARDPWAIVQLTPGVQADRINVGGNESGQSPRVAGGAGGDGEWAVNGVVIGELGATANYTVADSFEEVQVVTGGGDVTRAHGGVTVNVVTKRGTNAPRFDAHLLRAGGGSDDARDRVDEKADAGGAAGGPVVHDRLWAFGSVARRDADRTALDGDPGALRIDDGAVKLNAQVSGSNGAVVSWTDADVAEDGVAAGPRRAPEAALDLSSDAGAWSLDDTHVLTASFYLVGLYAETASATSALSPGRTGAVWDTDGVLRGGGRGGEERRDTRTLQASGIYFFNTGDAGHELTFGVRRRDASDMESHAWPGDRDALLVDPRNLDVDGDAEFFRREVPGTATADRRSDAGWLQDTLSRGRLTATAGLRWDRQRGSGERTAIDWSDLAPRLAVTATFGDWRRTALRASWGRYVQRLSSDLVLGADPSAGEALFRDDALVAAEGPWVIDPRLAPEWTDELVLGVEHSIWPELVVSLFYTHRERSGVHELRDLVIDAATGEVRAARAGDYVFDHLLRGTLPDGAPFEVPVYSLGTGVADAGAARLVAGDRRIADDGVTLSLEKRLSNRWMARGHVHYGAERWRLGPQWLAHHDPTDLVGSADDDGALYVEAPVDLDFGDRPWVQGRWSAALSGAVQLFAGTPWGFDLAAGVYAREGYPLPYYAWDLASADGLPRRVQATETVDAFRLDDVAVVDLRLAKDTVLFRGLSATWTLDVLNLFDEDAGLRREVNLSGARGGALEETVVARRLQVGVRLQWE